MGLAGALIAAALAAAWGVDGASTRETQRGDAAWALELAKAEALLTGAASDIEACLRRSGDCSDARGRAQRGRVLVESIAKRLEGRHKLKTGQLWRGAFLEEGGDGSGNRDVDAQSEMIKSLRRARAASEAADIALGREAAARRERGEARAWWAAWAALATAVLGAAGWLRRRNRVRGELAPAEPLIGGSYRIERELGRGGMGVVYLATDVPLKRSVALKRMLSDVVEEGEARAMLLREARAAASLRHPHIVSVLGVVEDPSGLHIALELIDGPSLHDYLEKSGRLEPGRALRILRGVALGLDYAHRNRVIHRDLKPSNIMLPGSGAKIMDFGIAHVSRMTASRLTRTRAWGTPAYMAPEQEMGEVCAASDLYALGVCAYQMLTGVLPFEEPNLLARKRSLGWRPPRSIVPGLPPAAETALARVMAPDPAARPADAASFIKEFAGAWGA